MVRSLEAAAPCNPLMTPTWGAISLKLFVGSRVIVGEMGGNLRHERSAEEVWTSVGMITFVRAPEDAILLSPSGVRCKDSEPAVAMQPTFYKR